MKRILFIILGVIFIVIIVGCDKPEVVISGVIRDKYIFYADTNVGIPVTNVTIEVKGEDSGKQYWIGNTGDSHSYRAQFTSNSSDDKLYTVYASKTGYSTDSGSVGLQQNPLLAGLNAYTIDLYISTVTP